MEARPIGLGDMAVAELVNPARVLLYDDQPAPGRTRADLLRERLPVTVTFASIVDKAVVHLLTSPFDLLILDYLEQSEFGSHRSCLEILEHGTRPGSLNEATPVMVHSILTVPTDERYDLQDRWNVRTVESRLFGDDHLVAVTARLLKLPAPPEETSVFNGGVVELVGWSCETEIATVVVPSRPEFGTLELHRRDLDHELVRDLDHHVGAIEPLSDEEPLLLRAEWNENAASRYELDLRLLQRLGPARLFRDQVRVAKPARVVDPNLHTDTDLGRRVESRAKKDEEWKAVGREWASLTDDPGSAD